ncbi:hypothetical protein BPT24_163 [Tenacibaculum phage pT24]|uniref:Uncharacterized protein n=1 Tax=Tenacibaculum phage pT24 TaxID=1880590 RepID=A0A1B4XWW0_9CAUD|nr:hypothetical protein HYP10_gp163 [Tenacibaculum phage pT24]BAV39289.1 hypothetical protein BPT24_163 [Tenacibaculum phage pT24]
MALKVITASNTERHEARQKGKHLIIGKTYHVDKDVEKFLNAYDKSPELLRQNHRSLLNDPTVNGFKLFFNFSATDGLLADESYPNSALKYLDDIGDTYRYNILKLFIARLSEVNTHQPWIFNNIEGLREVYTKPFEQISFFRNQNKLIIGTYETLDLKIASLNRMWREVVYDKNRKVFVLPENLRSFGLSVYVIDMRVFKTDIKYLRNWETQSFAEINHQLFEFGNCEFLTESGGAFYDAMTNMSVQENFNSFVIGFENVDLSMLSPSMMGEMTFSSEEMSLLTTVLSGETKDFTPRKILDQIATNTTDNISRYGESQASYYTYQEYQLSGLATRVSTLSNNIGAGLDDINNLLQGNIQGAGLANLIR